jgi:branched-chain amino acid transport system permease protein
MTYNVLLIVVLGGTGSITGSIIGAIIVTIGLELLRFLDGPWTLVFIQITGRPGMRMVVFSILLLGVILFRQQGLMGGKEFSWDAIVNIPRRIARLHTDLHAKYAGTKKKGAA